jgi:putative N6-adenine-specific DNA methylase
MGEREEIERLYQQLGGSFKALYPWQIYVLTSSDRFDRLYGQRADKVKKLYNGMLPCYLYEYFKPAEAQTEKGRTAKEIFDRKPRGDFDRGHDRGNDRNRHGDDRPYGDRKPYGPRADSRPHGDRPHGDRKPYGPRNSRTYPPKKKD